MKSFIGMSKSFNILDKHTDIFGNRFLTASAGTGKTFAIEHLFIRHIIDEETPINIREILIVTFTNAATFELKIRLKKALENALCNDNNIPYLKEYAQQQTVRYLQDALLSFDQAQIFTIHSFCLRMLKEFALFSGINFIQDDTADTYALKKKELLNFLRYAIKLPHYGSIQGEILLHNNIEEKIAAYGEKEFLCEEKAFLHYFESFKKIDKEKFSFLVNEFDTFYPCFKQVKKMKKEDLLEQLSLLMTPCKSIDQFNDIMQTSFFDFLKFFSPENRKIRSKLSEINEKKIEMFENDLSFLKDIIDERKIIKRLAYDAKETIDNLFLEKNILTFDRMLKQMLLATKNEEFVHHINTKYKVAIIDEFQDTDPIQLKIFKSLFLDKKIKSFYLIGDPKQSIYGFRNADLYSYFDAKKMIGDENVAQLDTNFRSDKNLIDALNTLFSKDKWLKLPKINSFLPYIPVKAAITNNFSFDDDKKPLHFFIGKDKSSLNKRWPTSFLEEELFFPFIKNEILKLQEKGLKIAVLVSDRYQMERIRIFLENYSIPTLGISHESILNTHAKTIMNEMLQAVADPTNRSKIKIAMHGPYFNYPLLATLQMEHFLFFNRLHEALTNGLSSFFAEFFKSSIDGKKSIEENILLNTNKYFYHDTLQLIELILAEERNISSVEKTFKILEKKDPQKLQRRIFYDGNPVEIMTIHKSKGLEFDIVFALGLTTRTYQEEDFMETEEVKEEKLRQFYVTLTRAKKRVYVPIAIDERPMDTNKVSCCDLFFGCEETHVLSHIKSLQELASYEFLEDGFLTKKEITAPLNNLLFGKEKTDNITAPTLVEKKENPISIYSFSGLHKEKERAQLLFEKTMIASDNALPTGAEVGVILHEILRDIFKENIRKANIRDIIKKHIIFTPLKEHEETILTMIKNSLSTPLSPESFTLLDAEDIVAEAEFLFTYENNYYKGFLDLFFQYRGKYYLLDWKSNWLEEHSSSYLKKVMQENDYFLQASIYAEAFLRYLKSLGKEDCFGGMFYFFLRGGIYHLFPEPLMRHHE
jgi:exodeoxyribonuclease V beta subunit